LFPYRQNAKFRYAFVGKKSPPGLASRWGGTAFLAGSIFCPKNLGLPRETIQSIRLPKKKNGCAAHQTKKNNICYKKK
jgi:hypothetical protein